MKNLRLRRRQIVRAIHAACLALFASFTANHASATPVYTPPYYTLNGSTVTGSGTSSAAYFNDTSTTFYTVNVASGANLSDATNSEIEIGRGNVTNKGTLTYTGSNYYLGGVIINDVGSVTNSGAINAPSSYSIQDYGTSGTVTNTGTLSSSYGTYFAGTVLFTNRGTMTCTDTSLGIGIYSGSVATIHNTGTITASTYGIQLDFDGSGEVSTVTNTGTINSTGDSNGKGLEIGGTALITNSGKISVASPSGNGIVIYGYSAITNSGTITAPGTSSNGIFEEGGIGQVTNNKGGTISGAYQGIYFIGGGTVTNAAGGTVSGSGAGIFSEGAATISNAGYVSAINSTVEAQGIGVIVGAGTVTNTGSVYLSTHDLAEGILIDSGTVTNSGSIQVLNTQSAYGIDVQTTGTVTNQKKGSIVASGSAGVGIATVEESAVYNYGSIQAGEYGVYAKGDDSTVTTVGGVIQGGTDSIVLAGMDSTVNVKDTAVTQGTIEGTNSSYGNVLNFQLTGLNATQAANFKTYVESHTSSGTYTVTVKGQSATYTWADFANVTDTST